MAKKFWKAAAIRALHTFCQAALAMIPAGVMINQVNWLTVLATALLAALISILKSIIVGCKEADPTVEDLEYAEKCMNELLDAAGEPEEEGEIDG